MDSTVDNPESRKKNGATEEGAIFTPRSVRLYKGMLIASIDCFLKLALQDIPSVNNVRVTITRLMIIRPRP